MGGRRSLPGHALQLALLLLHLAGQQPALAAADPAEAEGSGCQAADETSRLRCQLDEANILLSHQSLVIQDNIVELERKEALIKEKDIKLAWKDAVVKDMEAQLAQKEVPGKVPKHNRTALVWQDAPIEASMRASLQDQDARLARNAAPVEEPTDIGADSSNQRALTEEVERLIAEMGKRHSQSKAWQASTQSPRASAKSSWKEEQQKYSDLRRRHHLSKHVAEDGYRNPQLRRDSQLSKDLVDKDRHLLILTEVQDIIAMFPNTTTIIDFPGWGLTGFTGTLPADLGRMVNLEYLDLSSNSITGTIPPELGNLVNLQTLRLKDTLLNGTIPPELGNLTQLVNLEIYNALGIKGTIPSELGKLSKLTSLTLGLTQLSGTIPKELGNLVNLQTLNLAVNELKGTIPKELGNLAALKQLTLYTNHLEGTITQELGNLVNLQLLEFGKNNLTGTIPKWLCSLGNLTTLGLEQNQLNGKIPPELSNLTELTILDLRGNAFTGTIPPEIGKLTRLEHLYLDNLPLTGSIPKELGDLVNLQYLQIISTEVNGTIPPELGKLTRLDTLGLADDLLTGTIPPELGNLTQLTSLNLGNNRLTGSIPPSLGKLANLSTLALQGNRLTGAIPPELGDMAQVTYFLLNDNNLTGTIPPDLGKLTRLTNLYLSNNKLTGTIPSDIGNMGSLQNLVLNGNQLSGTLPPELGQLGWLRIVDLSSNRLTGAVPFQLGFIRWLMALNLAGNDLSGSLPDTIGWLQGLRVFDVSDNPGLTGKFPDMMGTQLVAIAAASCSFTSAGLVAWYTTTSIWFANNNLTELPEAWWSLPAVVELDVSHNQISVWRPHGVYPPMNSEQGLSTCASYPVLPGFLWPVIQSVKLSGNPIGLNNTLRDFIMSLSYLNSLSELYAAGCNWQGVVPVEFLVETFGVDNVNTGQGHCLYTNPAGFRGLLTLDLSDNNITAIMVPPPQRLSLADLHSNPQLVHLHAGWYDTPINLEVWNNSLLRVDVTPPFRETGCLTTGASTFEADSLGFASKLGEDAFQCTTLCAGLKTRYKHDPSLNVSSLCRCTAGRQGSANNCTGCPADTYSDVEDKWGMVRTCRPCPESSSTEGVDNATSVDQCKCQAGWYMETPAAGDANASTTPTCKRCKQGRFMDTLPNATQEAQCICNKSYDGLLASLGMCGCADGQYMDNAALACRRCDAVAERCTWGSDIGRSLLPPAIQPSYWAATPPEVGLDEASNFSKHDIWRCFSKDTCPGNGTCAAGRSGTACSLCAEGMFGGPDGPCKPCPYSPEESRKNLLYGLLIGPGATIAAHIVLNLRATKLASTMASLRTSLKQSLKYLQMLGVMAGFNIGWPPMALQFFTEVSRITVALPQVAGVACLAGQQTASLEMGFRWLLPVAGLLSACLSALVLAPFAFLVRRSRYYGLVRMDFWDVLRVTLWGLALFYSTLLQFGTQVLACTPGPNGIETVVTFPHLQCGGGGEWAQLAAVSCAFLLVFVGAVFVGIYAAWRRATHALVESTFASSGWWGFLFDDYRDGWGHWLMLTMAKDAALVVVATAGASDGPSQLLATAAVSIMYSYVVLRDQPFRDASNSFLEAWTMLSVAVLSVFTAGMGFQNAPGVADVTELFGDGASDPGYKKRERALLVVQIFTFAGPAGIVLYQLLCVSSKVRKRLPAFLRPPTEEERTEWNKDFFGSVKLDEATAHNLWGVMERLDVVDSAKLRDVMTTSTATLGIIDASSARGVSIKRMVRKRFVGLANASENFKVPAADVLDVPDAAAPDAAAPVPEGKAEDVHRVDAHPGVATVTPVADDAKPAGTVDVAAVEADKPPRKPKKVESL